MALTAGDKLGPYEIIALIGKGGMGEVYRAKDTRLRRDVAVKISQQQFNERFEREARAVASLNHPNICSLYDVGPNYLVMEYVEGESPAGPLPIDQAMEIARQIAEALSEAHEKGIVHRDLKPANIKIKHDGTVKVLDFGLAKIGGGPAASLRRFAHHQHGRDAGRGDFGNGRLYGSGTSSREKRGCACRHLGLRRSVARADHRPAPIQGRRPDRNAGECRERAARLERGSPARPKVTRSMLTKDPKKRLQAIGDMRLVLEAAEPPPSPAGLGRMGGVAWVIAGIAVLVAAGLGFVHFREAPAAERSLRLSIPLPENSQAGFLEISPDGKRVLLFMARDGIGQLYLRSLDSGELQPLVWHASRPDPFLVSG